MQKIRQVNAFATTFRSHISVLHPNNEAVQLDAELVRRLAHTVKFAIGIGCIVAEPVLTDTRLLYSLDDSSPNLFTIIPRLINFLIKSLCPSKEYLDII